MATPASEADSDTAVPDGDEDNKMCEEGVKLMADPLDRRTPWWWKESQKERPGE